MNELTPHKTIFDSKILDSNSVSLVRTIMPSNIVDCSKLEEGGSQADTDGYLDICDENGFARARITVQIKHLTYSSDDDSAFYDIPVELYAYAGIHKGDIVVFIACDNDNKRFFWKHISLEDVRIIEESEKTPQKTYRYHFSSEEICSSSNVNKVLAAWKGLYDGRMSSIKDDRQLAESFASLQKNAFSLISTELFGIEGSHISRRQVHDINEWIAGSSYGEDKRICLLVGDAGVGKSAVLKEVIDSQKDGDKKYLCIKADTIDDSGNNLTLEKMRDTIGFFSAGVNEVILIIDQIDALSQCLSNDRNHLNMMMTLLASLDSWTNVRAIVSCRKFDLDYDSDLRSLENKAKRIDLGELSIDEVSAALDKLENGLGSAMTQNTLEVLRTVQYLDSFCLLYKKSKTNINFNGPVDLYDELWNEYVAKAPSPIKISALEDVLYQIADAIRQSGTLKPVLSPSAEKKQSFDYLASCGLIKIDGCTVSLFHQSFYDYAIARKYSSSGKSLLKDISDDFQGLELRTTVKAVLEYELGHNGVAFVDEARSILASSHIRLHIKLLVISIIAFAKSPDKSLKKLFKDICPNDERLLVYFLRGVQDAGWFTSVKQVVKDLLPDQRKDSSILFPILSCLSRYVFDYPDDVYDLVNTIKDKETRKFSVAYILRCPNNYSNASVLKAYDEAKQDNTHFEVQLIRDAFRTNEKFAFEETGKVLVKYLSDVGESPRHDGYELVDVLFPDLLNNCPKQFLLTLHDGIVKTIEQTAYNGIWGFTDTKAFNSIIQDDYVQKILDAYENLLIRYSSDEQFTRPIVNKLLTLKNVTSVSVAFAAIAANPTSFDDTIRQLISDNSVIENYLHGDIEYFYLKMLKSWYQTLDNKDATWYQETLLKFKSSVDFSYDKERRLSDYLCPHLWRDQWKLICNTLPEEFLIPEMKKHYQVLLRRFGKRSVVERPDHSVSMAMFCGGVTSSDIYARWPIDNWLNSFLKLKEDRRWHEGRTPIDLRVHADEFKKCVASNPEKFKDFVFEISNRDDIKKVYKLAGVEGLLNGGVDSCVLWPLVEPLISAGDAIRNSSSFERIAEHYVKEENPHIDDVISIAESIALIPFDDKKHIYKRGNEDANLECRASDLLGCALNSPQGHAVKILIHASNIPERRCQIFGILNKMLLIMPECIKALCLNYIHNNSSEDESIFYPLVRELLAGLGPEALVIRGSTIQWCFYHKPEVVSEYINRIESDGISHEILAQVYFYGLSSEKNRKECEQRLEKILKSDDEKIVAKIVEVSLKSFNHSDIREYSRKYLERYASDDRADVSNAYCWYCEYLPVDAFEFYCQIAKSWSGKKHREIHSQLEYVKKCISRYPEKCYEFISEQKYYEINEQWIADDDVVRVLLQIYSKLKEDENEDCMNGIMDLFDEYIFRGNRMMMDAISKMN